MEGGVLETRQSNMNRNHLHSLAVYGSTIKMTTVEGGIVER